MFRICKKTKKGLSIGLESYTEAEALKRAEVLRKMGMRVLVKSESELFN